MLEVNVAKVPFKNPIIAASGTFGFGEEFGEIYNVSRLGGICSKGLTLNKKEGNDGIRIFETAAGILNSVGLQNPGVQGFIDKELVKMKKLDTIIIANLGGGTLEDYEDGAEKLSETSVDMIELNISCPNVKYGGMAFGIKNDVAYEVVSKVRKVCKKPLMVKLSPNAENITEMALACEKAGADAVSLINTIKGMAIDIKNKKSIFNNITAGLSGPAVKPIALRMVYEVSKAVSIPVVGIGGITSYKDVLEFLMAGATAVQIGTGNFMKPDICIDIIDGLESYVKRENLNSITEIIGII
jgi:dihydroorotate dehydrogenase (NAD+) catalytic subunit